MDDKRKLVTITDNDEKTDEFTERVRNPVSEYRFELVLDIVKYNTDVSIGRKQ